MRSSGAAAAQDRPAARGPRGVYVPTVRYEALSRSVVRCYSQHMPRGRIAAPAIATVGLALSLLVGSPVLAGYVASNPTPFTGRLTGDYGTSYCGRGQSKIGDAADPGDGQAFTRSAHWSSGCVGTSALTVSAGWLGAKAYVSRDGAYCGATAEVYNTGSTSLLGVGGQVCSNPSGSQVFETMSQHFLWDDKYDNYVDGWTASPRQNY